MKEERRIGVFLCNGGQVLSEELDFDVLKKAGKSSDAVRVVREIGKICTEEGLSVLRESIRENKLDSFVLAACDLSKLRKPVEEIMSTAGMEADTLAVVNIRELPTREGKRELIERKGAQSIRVALEKLLNLDELHTEQKDVATSTLVVGNGWTAMKAAAELADLGHRVMLVCNQNRMGENRDSDGYTSDTASLLEKIRSDLTAKENVSVMLSSQIVDFDGKAGGYRVTVKDPNDVITTSTIGGVILAPELRWTAHLEPWGLSASERVIPLSDFESRIQSVEYASKLTGASGRTGGWAVFLVGFTHQSTPLSQRRIFQAAVKTAEKTGLKPLVILDNYKVADTGLEALAQKARKLGAVVIKTQSAGPTVTAAGDKLNVRVYDDVLGEEITLPADIIVLEEEAIPRREAGRLQTLMKVASAGNGFYRAGSVYGQPIFTNRTGILAVGPAKGPLPLLENLQEAREAALSLHELLENTVRPTAADRVKLDRKKCTICLTCYRVCPHGAISVVNRRPVFSEPDCQACGVCAAECPMDAIQIHNFNDTQMRSQLKAATAGIKPAAGGSFVPSIVAFCCRNSAAEAAHLASLRKLSLPMGLEIIEVPCAGKVDMDYVLTAFKDGADGVMVMACHPQSCKSYHGNTAASMRIDELKDYLSESGLEEERIVFGGFAAGMSSEFVRSTKQFEALLLRLGENPIRTSLRFKRIA